MSFSQLFSATTFCLLLTSLLAPPFAQAEDAACPTKDISDYKWRVRNPSAIAARTEVEPGSIQSACVKLIGVGKDPLVYNDKKVQLSVNGGPFEVNKDITVREGDELRFNVPTPNKYNAQQVVRLNFKETAEERRRGMYRMLWQIQTANTSRKPEVWHVGPSSLQYKQIKDVLKYLVAGDTVMLEEGATFEPFEAKFVSGTEANPIRIIGDTKDPAKRPRFTGGTERFNWTMALRGSHNWVIENVILENGGLCFRNEANNTVLRNVLIRHCNTGLLGADMNSGSLSLYNVEMYDSGGKAAGRPWGHGIYASSDQHSFPGATFTIKNSYLHDNRGNTIKSRSQNVVIENNWIEGGTDRQAKYLLELIGYDQKYDFAGQQRLVKGNIMIHRSPGLGSRVGGDGNSPSRGDVTFTDNLFLLNEDYGRTIIRTFQGLRSLTVKNNSVLFIEDDQDVRFVTDEIADPGWVEGKPLITIEGNNITGDTDILRRDLTNEGDDRSAITISGNREIKPVVTSWDALADARPQKDGYISIKRLN